MLTPLREAAVPGRALLDVVIAGLMIYGAVSTEQNVLARKIAISFMAITALALAVGRCIPRRLSTRLEAF